MINLSESVRGKFKMIAEPRIENISSRKLVGKHLEMSIAEDRTAELWKSFMPVRHLIRNTVGNNLYSLQIHNQILSLNNFRPETVFTKWAAAEVTDFKNIPEDIDMHILTGGMYAVFVYKGLPSDFKNTFIYIFATWFPASEYEVDNREHFEILGSKYKNNDPESEEEIWIPVKKRVNH